MNQRSKPRDQLPMRSSHTNQDEIVGFTEQGFGLYIMSVWNAFDLGILLLFVSYYVLASTVFSAGR